MSKKHMGYALLGFAAFRLYHEMVGFGNASLKSIGNAVDQGGKPVTWLLAGVGGYLVYKS